MFARMAIGFISFRVERRITAVQTVCKRVSGRGSCFLFSFLQGLFFRAGKIHCYWPFRRYVPRATNRKNGGLLSTAGGRPAVEDGDGHDDDAAWRLSTSETYCGSRDSRECLHRTLGMRSTSVIGTSTAANRRPTRFLNIPATAAAAAAKKKKRKNSNDEDGEERNVGGIMT